MKVAIIGIGQCGCNIADEFYSVGRHTETLFRRRIEIVTDILAINTDTADLRSPKHIPEKNRILVGAARTFGHGVGKVNTEAAKIFADNHMMLAEEIANTRKFYETDAVVVIASAAGGTGSGGIGQVMKILKERLHRHIIAIVVLPYAYEESGAASYALTNAATCLRTVDEYADVIFLLDNEKFSRGAIIAMANSYHNVNQRMVNNFYDLFCAGEEKRRKYIGTKVTDAGDIIASLSGISVIGRGEIPLPTWRFRKYSLDEGTRRANFVAMALKEAISNLSTDISLKYARRVLTMLCAPKEYITQPALQEIYQTLLDEAPEAQVRLGDYPRRDREVSVTIVASELALIPRVERLYIRGLRTLKTQKTIRAKTGKLIQKRKDMGKDIPRLA